MSIGKGAWNGGKRCCGTVQGRERQDFKTFPSLKMQRSKGFKARCNQSESSQDGLRGASAITPTNGDE